MTCMSTRAVHLELVLDLTTQEFLLAFRRFIARRGAPSIIYSDNSTTFRSAETAVASLIYSPTSWHSISSFCSTQKIIWKFITPLSPWKGGFYERLVGLFKSAYKKSIGRAILSLSQLQTVVTEVEATLNCRPITPYRERETFVHILRPIDFLSPQVDLQIPPLPSQIDDIYDASHNLSQWYKDSLSVLDHFWELWHSDYLTALRERHQARTKQPRSAALAPQLGDVVLIADEKSPRGQWNYGMIVSLISGKDGAIRAAEVRTASGKCLTRSISHLYPLEIRAITTYAPPQDSLRTLPQDSPLSPSRQDSPAALSPARTQPKRSAKTKHLFIRT
ncbi:unnamed protein product [Heligmosomoides polygyrus]|uniref:Integrase catalytic domain-containing protein n=1 Tax=Heligmosomoides polygyrus TaxID=6339 RepID=A0A183GPA9_HELPZ|nr:unnamed protein product [Heligmosomoides polygyrus]